MSSSRKKSTPQPEWHYEATVAKVEAIIEQIETGNLDLEAVFDQFAEATRYLQECDQFLSSRQEKIELLIETLGDSASQ
ncbi:exodeoxyribonuclease VII small subunit [Lyngbya confervoides]|uniref:Exodeoxyribonuclease 7 small subunit n=1 Tax=Lyngbya confervoides BDU141951 TaxID=1574623 RepID=A0ABD4T4U7_9CYAN|nr:exodeoxyribonuclease VII small subunit [Lyngbya confervoides]MCM1983732.1 exodeoxyribonuclease VII small subunit [Lyngbya confervoides BDU141951]